VTATEQHVHRSFFKSQVLGVWASTPGVSIQVGRVRQISAFVDKVRAILLYLNRLVGLHGISGTLVSIAFKDNVRLWEDVEFMQHPTTLPESCPPFTIVRGWFGDAIHIFGRQYCPMGRYDQLPECDTASIVAHMQRLYLTGPRRQGPVKAIYDSLRDGASYCCAPYKRSQYFTEAYRTLARFCTGFHDLAGTTGRWIARESSSFHEHRLCIQCYIYIGLRTRSQQGTFIFECPTGL
jgi:hypothetical protein